MILFLSLDIGTTSVKTALIDEAGKLQAISLKEYTLHTPAEKSSGLDMKQRNWYLF